MTHENFKNFDYSRMTNDQLQEAFFALSKERGERLQQEIAEVKNLIAALREHFPELSERDILIRALESDETMPTEAEVRDQLQKARWLHKQSTGDINIHANYNIGRDAAQPGISRQVDIESEEGGQQR